LQQYRVLSSWYYNAIYCYGLEVGAWWSSYILVVGGLCADANWNAKVVAAGFWEKGVR